MNKFFLLVLLLTVPVLNAQDRPTAQRVKVTGTVLDKVSRSPLEYTTITMIDPDRPASVSGGMADAAGKFSFDVIPGNYNIRIEFISFKAIDIQNRQITSDTNLGTFYLEEDATLLNEVEIRQEISTVDIKLDKKVYNVGQDMMVKGGTVSDVLDNVPSVTVDVEGNVSLRGNENVRILIDGKPSGLGGINIAEALKLIPADALDKVEVITNPSARYDAEGGGGILNIILKKGKNQGVNGTFTATTGAPANHGITGTLNYKTENFNLFTTHGYSYRKGPGNGLTDTEYLDDAGNTTGYNNERRTNERLNKSYNGNFGMEWYLTKDATWTNTLSYRKNNGENPDSVVQFAYGADRNPTSTTRRFNREFSDDEDIDFSSNFVKKFKREGHQLSIDASFSTSDDNDDANVETNVTTFGGAPIAIANQRSYNVQDQTRNMIQADYVLPFGKAHRFEFGYRSNITDLTTDYTVETLEDDNWVNDEQFSNVLEYKESVHALYTQLGTKINNLSLLGGLRWEDTDIEINQITQDINREKKYDNFFPTAFAAYEFSPKSTVSFSYSKRISRPRSRSINPFVSLSSNINIFRGNPDLDASISDVFDIGYLKRWNKITLNTSMYYNRTSDAVQMVRNTEIINGIPALVVSPVNVGQEDRYGFEFTLTYSAFKWWRLNSNLNLFRNQTMGNYTYTDLSGIAQTIDFSNTAYSGFARINSKVNLPYSIDWQTNVTYNAPQTNAQGTSRGILSANLALSKDVLKDKGTISLNVSDLFNSRKRISEVNLARQNAYSEMQWRERQINLSFTYRFNKKKGEKDPAPKREMDNDGEFMGG